jgi:hypothetical protein
MLLVACALQANAQRSLANSLQVPGEIFRRSDAMDRATKGDLRKGIDAALSDLEQLADEVRVKLHLANLQAKDTWNRKLEPRLDQARRHAQEATSASKAAVEETVKALREFARSL